MLTVQAPAPVHAPDQRSSTYPALGVAVTVTFVPESYVPPPLTLPPPDGEAVAVSVYRATKTATTRRLRLMVTEQAPVPVQAPDQRRKR